MKIKKTLKLLLVSTLMTLIFNACEEILPVDELTLDLTSENKNFIFNTSFPSTRLRLNGIGPLGYFLDIQKRLDHNNEGRIDKQNKGILSYKSNKDENLENFLLNNFDNYNSGFSDCVNSEIFPLGNNTFIYSLIFEEGCEYLNENYSGAISELVKFELIEEDSISVEGEVFYSDFGTNAWKINGEYSYIGSIVINGEIELDEEGMFIENENIELLGKFNFDFDLNESYFEESITTLVASAGNGFEIIDNQGINTLERNIKISIDSGEEYSSSITESLLLSYECEDSQVFTHVLGKEEGTIVVQGVIEDYSIDYGNGSCDNIIYVNKGDESFTINLEEEFENIN